MRARQARQGHSMTSLGEANGRGALAFVEEALWSAAQAVLPAAALAPAAMAAAVVERSRRYTSERDLLDLPMAGAAADADLAARALFFAVADAAKVTVPLSELGRSDLVPAGAPLRILDLGAGAGAMTLGTAAALAARGRAASLSVVAIDRDHAALTLFERAASHLAAALGAPIAIERRAEQLRHAALDRSSFDLVLAGGVLNELDEPSREDLVGRALASLAGGGSLILIEPALRQTSRDLHRLRDRVLAAGRAHVFAPCTRTAPSCPALARERDWCHEDRPLSLPPRAARLAHVTGLREGGMKFAYLVLRRAADPLVAAAPGRAALRVVSDPRREKGRRECLACGDDGWVQLRLLSRHRADVNRPFERLRRGDVVLIDRAKGPGLTAPFGRAEAPGPTGPIDRPPLRDLRTDESVDRILFTDDSPAPED